MFHLVEILQSQDRGDKDKDRDDDIQLKAKEFNNFASINLASGRSAAQFEVQLLLNKQFEKVRVKQ